jgi:hypothetical protein
MFHEIESSFLKNGSISMNLCGVMQSVICIQDTKFRLPLSNGYAGRLNLICHEIE